MAQQPVCNIMINSVPSPLLLVDLFVCFIFYPGQIQQPEVSVRPYPHIGRGVRTYQPNLDSRFILDVNVIDGTVMAPSIPFTKTWRMRNTGNAVWPRGTQLVWIGGDRFSEKYSVEVCGPIKL